MVLLELMANVAFGQDEVVAVSRKMVVRVEDLVRWTCVQPSCWSRRVKAAACGTNGVRRPPRAEDGGGGGGELLKDKTESKKRRI